MTRQAITKTVELEPGSESAGRAAPHRGLKRSLGVSPGDQSEAMEHDLSPTVVVSSGLREQVAGAPTIAYLRLGEVEFLRVLLTVQEAAEALGVSCATIRRKVKARRDPLPSHRQGGEDRHLEASSARRGRSRGVVPSRERPMKWRLDPSGTRTGRQVLAKKSGVARPCAVSRVMSAGSDVPRRSSTTRGAPRPSIRASQEGGTRDAL